MDLLRALALSRAPEASNLWTPKSGLKVLKNYRKQVTDFWRVLGTVLQRLSCWLGHETVEGAEADAQILEKKILLVKAIVCHGDIAQTPASPPPQERPMKDQVRVVSSKQEPRVRFRVASQPEQHS